jgi:SAM-dependent methyltransferase
LAVAARDRYLDRVTAVEARPDPARAIPRGNTQRGVTRAVLSVLQATFRPEQAFDLLDIPCGCGEFGLTVKQLFPSSHITCADLHGSGVDGDVQFVNMDAAKSFPFEADERFDAITSISGVMEFDNTEGFVSECAKRLKPRGRIVITNDNGFTVRDRLSYLLLGRVRRFKLLLEPHACTYKHIPVQELAKIFAEQDLALDRVEYVSLFAEDLLFLPLALVLYPLLWVYLRTLDSSVSLATRAQLFPLRALLCRHYLVVGTKA